MLIIDKYFSVIIYKNYSNSGRKIKLKLYKSGEDLILDSGFGHVNRFIRGALSAQVGIGEASYTMDHGRFRFHENLKFKTDLVTYDFVECGGGFKTSLCDSRGEQYLTAYLSVNGDIFTVHFETYGSHTDLNRMWVRIPAKRNEHVYGGGEVFQSFDLRGESLRVWVAEHTNSAAIAKKIAREAIAGPQPKRKEKFSSYETYYAQPTFVSSEKYFFHTDATSFVNFNFKAKTFHEIEIREISDIHIGFASDFEKLSEVLTSITGRQPELPDWVYDGVILGIQGGNDVVEEKIKKCEKFDTPIAGVWCQDWEGKRVTAFGKQLMWNWSYDRDMYPNLSDEIKSLNKRNIKFLGYVNPFLAVERELYQYASAHGYCVKDKNGKDYLVKITTFPAAMVDLTNPDACEWIKNVIKKNMIELGLSGWMADFGEYLPTDCVLYSGEDPAIVHNTWPVRWAEINRQAVEEAGKLGDIMFFTRAGFTGTGKYTSMMWNGDQHVDWSYDCGMPSVITGSLQLSLCGIGLVHSDMGGYITFPPMTRTKELMQRWTELSAFSVLMRSHEGNKPDSNAQFDFDEDTLYLLGRMSRIHKALKPYLHFTVRENSEKGVPVMRPLFYYYDENIAYVDSTEYLLGRDLLVAPIIEQGSDKRLVYLPEDEWIDIWTGKEYSDGSYTVFDPMGKPPVFYRKSTFFKELFEKIGTIE